MSMLETAVHTMIGCAREVVAEAQRDRMSGKKREFTPAVSDLEAAFNFTAEELKKWQLGLAELPAEKLDVISDQVAALNSTNLKPAADVDPE